MLLKFHFFLTQTKPIQLTGITKARVFPDPVFAAPRISLSQSACGREALWISVISTNLAPRRPSLVLCEIGSCSNFVAPAYRENDASSRRPMGSFEGSGGSDMGLDPESGFWDWTHEFRSSISWVSERRFCFRKFLDLGFFIV